MARCVGAVAQDDRLPARIVGVSTEIDLALLKVDGSRLPALPLATYLDVRQGETVFAFGSPSGLRNTLTHGLISAVARQTDPDSPLIYIQTDAPINPGIPAVRSSTSVAKSSASTPSSCRSRAATKDWASRFPSATVRTVFRQLKEFGQLRRQEVGMSLQTITHEMAALGLERDYGVIVSDVWPKGRPKRRAVRRSATSWCRSTASRRRTFRR